MFVVQQSATGKFYNKGARWHMGPALSSQAKTVFKTRREAEQFRDALIEMLEDAVYALEGENESARRLAEGIDARVEVIKTKVAELEVQPYREVVAKIVKLEKELASLLSKRSWVPGNLKEKITKAQKKLALGAEVVELVPASVVI